MILKIEKIDCIGKFKNYQATGDVAFNKLTLIYADNGSGKTTLTSILRSLTQNKPELIRKRKSINSSLLQSAQIIQRHGGSDTYHTFNSSGWSICLPNIEIFDIHFVNENIYSGFDFNEEQKKQLCQFVIGAQGVAIQQQIEQNKQDKSTSRQVQASILQQLYSQVGNNLDEELINDFIAMPISEATNIDQKISLAEAALVSANSNSTIVTLPTLSAISKINFNVDLAELSKDLETSVQGIQDRTLQTLLEQHCNDLSHNHIDAPEQWLKKGFTYLEVKNEGKIDEVPFILSCPFCKREIDSPLDIINAYSQKFNDEFNQLVARIQSYLTQLQNFNLDVKLNELSNQHQNNAIYSTSWNLHLSNRSTLSLNISSNAIDLSTCYGTLLTTIQTKLNNPSVAIDTKSTTDFESSLEKLNTIINTYNQEVVSYNAAITIFKSNLQTIQQARLQVDKFKRIKSRFMPSINSLCAQLVSEKQNLRTLESAYPSLIQQQQTASTTFFANYKSRINSYLRTVFKTPFQIENVQHIAPQGRSTQSKLGYKLTIDGHDISFDHTQSNSAKDCLSEGDKSTIALAFFLSKLDIDAGLSDKIVVFDDPLSSFDSNRRLNTVQLIKDLMPRVKQVVVLSHNEFFLHHISKHVAASDKKVLRITENFTTKASVLEPLNLESLVENDYFKNVKELQAFLLHADIAKRDFVLGMMRNILEAHIQFKFYNQTSSVPQNERTLGRLITALENSGVLFRDNSTRITIIQKLRLINGISCRPHHGEPIPDYSQLGTDPNPINVVELSQFVQDTLDLIDNKL